MGRDTKRAIRDRDTKGGVLFDFSLTIIVVRAREKHRGRENSETNTFYNYHYFDGEFDAKGQLI